MSVSDCVADSGVVPESVTFTVKVELPTLVGVPERTPLLDNVIPAGKVPLASVHVNGAVPPVALNCTLYGVPITPGDTDVLAITGAGSSEISTAAANS